MPDGRFLIAPFNSGLQDNVRPFLLPEDAFQELNNAYVFRGRVRKRFGTTLTSDGSTAVTAETAQLSSRLRISVGTTDGNGDLSSSVFLDGSAATTKYTNSPLGSMFSIGDDIFTVYQAAGAMYISGGTATTHTFDTVTGDFVFVGADATTIVYFYPALPVMGIMQNETVNINDEPTYVFDTKFSYQFANNGWERFADEYWTGSNSDFFWGRVWRGTLPTDILLFVTNFVFDETNVATDPIRYLSGGTWTDFAPAFSAAGSVINQARIIIPFKDRLLLMNTVENTDAAPGTYKQYGFRLRFSQNGSPLDANAFREDIAGRGGFVDAPTQEQIISAEIIKDRLLVFCERSTFEIVYTGNEILPFRFQYVDDQLGVESTFSLIPFDNRVVGIGDTGIHAATSTSVQRIDEKIPDLVSEIGNQNNGLQRVHGIRDYYKEVAYWAYPQPDETFPTKLLVYNYQNNSWAIFDDSITAFGYFQNQNSRTWQASLDFWEEAEYQWNSGALQSKHKTVIGGNQQGWVFKLDNDFRNDPSLQITNVTTGTVLTVYNHNLVTDDYVAIENLTAGVTIGQTIVRVVSTSADTVNIDPAFPITGTYAGQATIARVSRPSVLTKQYNFYLKEGMSFDVDKIDILAEKTGSFNEDDDAFEGSEFAVEWFVNSSREIIGSQVLQTYPYDDPIYAFENTQTQVWRRIYPEAEGSFIQLRYFLNDAQMQATISAWGAFMIHATMYHAMPTRDRFV
jgi:hypothetical protein